MKYALLCDPSSSGLETQVITNLKQGWKLLGGVTVSPMERDDYTPGTLLFCQAMTLGSIQQWRASGWEFLTGLFCRR